MRTERERLARMHRRARELQWQKDRSLLRVWGGVSLGLFLCLLGLAGAFSAGHGLPGSVLSGSSLLSESAGGYVLIGVLAFMLGVVVTVILLRRRMRADARTDNENERRM